jgi:hypothetical protein
VGHDPYCLRPSGSQIKDDKDGGARCPPDGNRQADWPKSRRGRVLKDSSTTFEWFVRNRYFPLRKGDWRPETAKEKMAQIEIDLIAKFGEYPLDAFDRFMLQTHVNDLALRYS